LPTPVRRAMDGPWSPLRAAARLDTASPTGTCITIVTTTGRGASASAGDTLAGWWGCLRRWERHLASGDNPFDDARRHRSRGRCAARPEATTTTAIRAPRSSGPSPRVRRRVAPAPTPTRDARRIHGQREQIACRLHGLELGLEPRRERQRVPSGADGHRARIPSDAMACRCHRRQSPRAPARPSPAERCLPVSARDDHARSQPRHATKRAELVASVSRVSFPRANCAMVPMVVACPPPRIAFRAGRSPTSSP